MTSSSLDEAIAHYQEKLDIFKKASSSHPSPQQVLELLQARDEVERLQLSQPQISTQNLLSIIELDQSLKEQATVITRVVPDLSQWREIIKNRTDGWWWSFKTNEHFCDRFDWLWRIITIICVIGLLSLAGNIAPRFLAGGPSAAGAFSIFAPSLLSLLLGKESIEQASRGQAFLERILGDSRLPKILWQEVICVVAVSAFSGMMYINFSLPKIATSYYCRGLDMMKEFSPDEYRKAHEKGGDCSSFDFLTSIVNCLRQVAYSSELASAESNLKVAIALNPNYANAHFQLGWLYELRQALDQAREHYQIAIQNGSVLASTRLASLYLRDDSEEASTKSADMTAAILNLLKDSRLEKEEKKTQRSFHILLGWARLQQERYTEAKTELKRACNLHNEIMKIHNKKNKNPCNTLLEEIKKGKTIPERTILYCVIAELRDKENQKNEALIWWKNCKSYVTPGDPDEDIWLGKAYKRLNY